MNSQNKTQNTKQNPDTKQNRKTTSTDQTQEKDCR